MTRTALLLGLVVLAVAGCGGDDEGDSGGGGATTLAVAADPGGALKFTQAELTTKAGTVKVELDNRSTLPHDVAFERDGEEVGKTPVVTNASATADVELQTGSYTFYCTVTGHREAGMEGTLTVE